MDEVYKMYCVVSKQALAKMGGVRGKLATQAGHAYLHSFWDSAQRFPAMAAAYQQSQRAYKITLAVESDEQLSALELAYRPICGVSLVTDAGLTVFKEPTTTCLGIGPLPDSLKGLDLKELKPLT